MMKKSIRPISKISEGTEMLTPRSKSCKTIDKGVKKATKRITISNAKTNKRVRATKMGMARAQ
jgi:hypothetical protein